MGTKSRRQKPEQIKEQGKGRKRKEPGGSYGENSKPKGWTLYRKQRCRTARARMNTQSLPYRENIPKPGFLNN